MLSLTFTYYWLLLFLIVPAMMVVGVWGRQSRRVVMPLDHGKQGDGIIKRLLIDSAQMLPAALLAVVIFILAGPQLLSEPRSKRVMTNIEFCVDISGSMTAKFGEGSRYDASMAAIDDFLNFREGDAFGLTFFGNSFMHWVPLTTDTSAIRCAPPFMRPEIAPPWFGGTEIGKALLACRTVLTERKEGDRMIILVSDGYSSDLSNGADQEIAAKLIEDDITVYAIHISSTAIPDAIVNITARTGGDVFSPGDMEGLQSIFRRIDEMQETKIEKISAESVDNFVPYCIAGLSVLAMCCISMFGLRYTPW